MRLHQALTDRLVERLDRDPEIRAEVEALVNRIASGEIDQYTKRGPAHRAALTKAHGIPDDDQDQSGAGPYRDRG